MTRHLKVQSIIELEKHGIIFFQAESFGGGGGGGEWWEKGEITKKTTKSSIISFPERLLPALVTFLSSLLFLLFQVFYHK